MLERDFYLRTMKMWWRRVRGMNLMDEYATVSGGDQNLAEARYSIVPGGSGGRAHLYGMMAHGAGSFAAVGDAQRGVVLARAATTDATPLDLLLGGSERLVLRDYTSWVFRGLIVGALVSGAGTRGDSSSYKLEGLIRRGANAAATVLVGSSVTLIAEDAACGPWSNPGLSADTTNGALQIQVRGQSGDTVRWVGMLEIVEIGW
jgi:hypothetical protein